ncbi:NAD-dependent epimerase/dehydratase family protein [Knoellia sp. p5-6-4]|uniref:NAD-dependent epimerase/dehydratase family protein n=1 Tax=unclassified Knoellia TaxID=2618719 RepID=UPI0023D99868|nr:NAD-dependent epimerase/dehydratase family protein [Knoellia sp. p5-6-4]MDF2145567.1 NAD-dependent epimerase/dehydratase family protein [Knoellia sp. p5-6-4]
MQVVVTGASGIVGSALLRALTGRGHDVTAVCRRVPQAPGAPGRAEGVTWVSHDLADRAGDSRLPQFVRDADGVVHLAWGLQPMHNRGHLRRVDLGGSLAVIRAVRAERVPHLVFGSSVGTYAPRVSDEVVDERWPATGIPGSVYSRHKAFVERVLDRVEEAGDDLVVARTRPSLVGQRAAGSAMLRLGFPFLLPAPLLRHVGVLPLDRGFALQFVHADDVADAMVRILESRAGGAFNLAADGVLRQPEIADAFGGWPLHLPRPWALRLVGALWRAGVQPLDPGWLEMAFRVPFMDTARARDVLGWQPQHTAREVLDEVVAGMADRADGPFPPLRARTPGDELGYLLRHGPVWWRPET